ncbi:uncharacterized protein LAESUDRAFT_719024 [Laetiporus sulphureus 93-53]|uniref:PABS domain-containing protein n=1 Tax=Laetiporus sulphureus 93-53 TaxID=1314785 RepID=A0A165I8I7_9APHY|nr:uncharacterized protein LAESUDRAFT_719024 [Laetiporus sulphureus 93-53]KZT12729.1 hypothetical protein LAESUDRAFT_719024 [Laetiporus sulphureus 93-53]
MSQRASTKSTVIDQVVSKTLSVVIVLGLSLVVFAYRRSLTPLYGAVPTDHHFNKVVWGACIVGSFAPRVSISPAILAAGLLLCLMPNSAYWMAVYTGRMGNVIWGPVVTHLTVITPVIALGVAVVKALQHDPNQEQAAPQQMITLPIAQTTIMTLQELWAVTPCIKDLAEDQIMLQAGTLALVTWAVSPLLASSPPPSPAPDVPSTVSTEPVGDISVRATKSPSTPTKGRAQRRRKPSTSKVATVLPATAAVPAASTPPSLPPPKKITGLNLARLLLLPILPFLTSTVLQSPVLSKPLLQPYIHPTYPLRILSSVRSSFSGVVVVGEALPPTENQPIAGDLHSLRYLRAGHSLLGGRWIGELATMGVRGEEDLALDQNGEPLGESIYAAFVLQEAARLVEKPDGRDPQNALVIGLGAGISASAFMKHNVSTTIIEIDRAVYDAARHFFALPKPDRLVIKDAATWIRQQTGELNDTREAGGVEHGEKEQYDIVVHDVFSGGSLPSHLFTMEFWNSTKAILKADGVLAVNLAGPLNSDSSRAIILTIESMFGQCRAFCDELDPAEQARNEYHNWVVFCSTSSQPPTFRAARESDYLGSLQRASILSTLSRREADLTFLREGLSEEQKERYLLTNMRNPLEKWQEKEALNHWKIMRQVLPDVIWETY